MNRRSGTIGAFVLAVSVSFAWAFDLPAPITDADYLPVERAEAELGQLLFYDPILSGNRNIACGTCHHPKFGTSDGVSLGLGEGGIGLGPDRHADSQPVARIARNAPALWNLGAREFSALFHDGRVAFVSGISDGIRTPFGADMVDGITGLLAAQVAVTVLSPDEMAGHAGENEIAQAVAQGRISGQDGAWALIAARIAAIPEYERLFNSTYPHVASGQPIEFTDIFNAIAGFVAFEWRSDDSPFDDQLNGLAQMPDPAQQGMDLFYGALGCADCHSGKFQTDHSFHAMAVPQLGPGKPTELGAVGLDLGRMLVSGAPQDAYRFRTPSLRNVTQTAPYGHSGAFRDLRAFLRHHADPMTAYDRAQVILPELPVDDWVAEDAADVLAAYKATPKTLTEQELDYLVTFLQSLTGLTAGFGRLGVPQAVPSGLSVGGGNLLER